MSTLTERAVCLGISFFGGGFVYFGQRLFFSLLCQTILVNCLKVKTQQDVCETVEVACFKHLNNKCVCGHAGVCVCVCVSMRIHVCVCTISACMPVCVCVCVCMDGASRTSWSLHREQPGRAVQGKGPGSQPRCSSLSACDG